MFTSFFIPAKARIQFLPEMISIHGCRHSFSMTEIYAFGESAQLKVEVRAILNIIGNERIG